MKTLKRRLIPLFLWLLVPAVLLTDPSVIAAGEKSSPEGLLKAAYIYNFAKFVDWPATSFKDSDSPLIIAIVGRDPMEDALKALEGKEVQGRKISVFFWNKVENLLPCHILYVGFSEQRNLAAIFQKTRDWDVLTVGEAEGFILSGGIILFFLEENKIRFEINNDMAFWNNLRISSRLMQLSRTPKKN